MKRFIYSSYSYFCSVNRNNIRLVIVLGAICIAGITITQIYWVKKVFDITETQFDVNVSLGLKNVADSVAFENHLTPALASPVTRLTANYFVVKLVHSVSPQLLERFLKNEFAKRGLQQKLGLVMYESDKLVYSKCLTFNALPVDSEMLHQIPNINAGNDLSFQNSQPGFRHGYLDIFELCVINCHRLFRLCHVGDIKAKTAFGNSARFCE